MSEETVPQSAERARPVVEKVKADQEIIHPEGHEWGEEMNLAQRALYRFMWWFVQSIARSYFRLRVYGHHNVPATGAYIISPIHRSNLDTPLVSAVTRRRIRYMGKESLWKSAFGAWFLTAMGGFPVDRATADRDALKACIEVLRRGEPLVMFPEGTRQFGPTVCPLFDGPAYVASRAQVPILPIGIGGTERAMGKGSKLPRPVRLTLVIGEPISPPPLKDGGRVSRNAVRELTGRLGEDIQVLFDEAQALAGHPNEY
ncbi:MAG: 1-acyl-sn-glycerol-3-phosphate acyltransferase [Acidimicrobiales bacterium]|jgi:1-acyl-sn-glycerol-3-phosphate acyltransferase|nr:1-acyl-sn-glycerol-3-phosphate acyltransferase [Acidimicrobiales bacterium]